MGKDTDGNCYYEDRRKILASAKKPRRWVVYKGIAEASKVPAAWHDWLHYTTDLPPLADLNKQQWEKDHKPNLTGTILAYKPSYFPKFRKKSEQPSDYSPWNPKK